MVGPASVSSTSSPIHIRSSKPFFWGTCLNQWKILQKHFPSHYLPVTSYWSTITSGHTEGSPLKSILSSIGNCCASVVLSMSKSHELICCRPQRKWSFGFWRKADLTVLKVPRISTRRYNRINHRSQISLCFPIGSLRILLPVAEKIALVIAGITGCLLYTSPSPRD